MGWLVNIGGISWWRISTLASPCSSAMRLHQMASVEVNQCVILYPSGLADPDSDPRKLGSL